jgi:hypothetical protein
MKKFLLSIFCLFSIISYATADEAKLIKKKQEPLYIQTNKLELIIVKSYVQAPQVFPKRLMKTHTFTTIQFGVRL